LRSPDQPVTPSPKTLGDDVPFTEGWKLAVGILASTTGRTDSFIDDLIKVFLDTPENRIREPHAVPLAVHDVNRPHGGSQEPIPRRDNINQPKLEAEGTPAEVQIVLGWLLDCRALTVALPSDKFIAWSADLAAPIEGEKATLAELDSLIQPPSFRCLVTSSAV
jgi:hypothetical protein